MSKQFVTIKQLDLMISFMEQNRELFPGGPQCMESRAEVKRLWMKLAGMLNSKDLNGANKAPNDWRQFFNEYKHRIKNKALKMAKNHSYMTGANMTLSPLQDRVCALIWPDNPIFQNNPIVQNNPLGELNEHSSIMELPDNINSESMGLFETVAEIPNLKKESFPDADDEDFAEMDMLSLEQPTTEAIKKTGKCRKNKPKSSNPKTKKHTSGQSNQTEQPSREMDSDKSWDTLADIEKSRLEVTRAKLDAKLARNTIEKQKADALKDLAGAAWAIVDMLKNTYEVGNNRKRHRSPSHSE